MAARRLLTLSAALAAALACVQNDGSKTPFQRLIEVTPANEREMGARLDAWARENLRLIDDPFVLASVNDLGQSLVRRVEPQPFVYRFRVVDDPTLNAFAGPAGYIYFHAGLILAAGSVDELAGVMAHEIAHAKRSHVARSIEKATVPDLLAKLLGVGVAVAADEPGAMIAAEGVSASLQLAYSRELEAEADEVGAAFLVRAGFDPTGMATFFERLGAQKQPDLGFEIPPYLQSHPQVEARLDAAVARARSTTQAGEVDPGLREAFPALQLRLARVLDSGRTTLPSGHPAPDPRVRVRRSPPRSDKRLLATSPVRSRRSRTGRRASPTTRAFPSGAASCCAIRASARRRSRRGAARSRSIPRSRSPTSRSGARTRSWETASTRSSISSRPSVASSRAAPGASRPSACCACSPTP